MVTVRVVEESSVPWATATSVFEEMICTVGWPWRPVGP
jgi:hypothetical protein